MRLFSSTLLLALATPAYATPNVRRATMENMLVPSKEHCVPHEIDFVMVEGDAVKTSVEAEIVEMLAEVGIKVNTRMLSKDEYNAAEQAGDFHLSFSETWGAPYDPHAYAKGWVAGDEGHNQAMSGLENPDSAAIFAKIEAVLKEENHVERGKKWEEIHKNVHDSATMLSLWGKRIPTVMNSKRLTKFQPGNQQFDYPVHELDILEGPPTVTIAPGAQTGLFSSVGRLDPHTYRPNEFFANNWVYEGLVSYGSYGQILPALAKSWSVDDKDDGQRHTFNLREGVTFHDGAAWNCTGAKLNFDHVTEGVLRTSDWHGWYGLMDQIKNWECLDEMTFAVDTKDKYYPFLQELSFIRPLRMLSPAAFAGLDPVTSNSCHVGWEPEGITCAGITAISGTGPFRFVSRAQEDLDEDTTVDNEVVFAANEAYWDGPPSIKELIIKRYDDSEAVKAALLDGSLDLVWGSGVLPAEDLIALDADDSNDLAVYHSDDIQNVIILLNSGKAPLDDVNLRKTVIHAIDKVKIIDDNLGGLFKPVDNVFPKDAPFCDVDITPRWDYDIEKAMFLNCLPEREIPEPEVVTVTVTEEAEPLEANNALALGLGLGIGIPAVLLLVTSITYAQKNQELKQKLEGLEAKEGAVGA